MCAGGVILGFAVANPQMYRFAAAGLVDVTLRPKAITWATAGGVVAAVLGPTLAGLTHDLLRPMSIATYVAMMVMHVIAFTIMGFIRFPAVIASTRADGQARPLWQTAMQPDFAAAVIAGVAAGRTGATAWQFRPG